MIVRDYVVYTSRARSRHPNIHCYGARLWHSYQRFAGHVQRATASVYRCFWCRKHKMYVGCSFLNSFFSHCLSLPRSYTHTQAHTHMYTLAISFSLRRLVEWNTHSERDKLLNERSTIERNWLIFLYFSRTTQSTLNHVCKRKRKEKKTVVAATASTAPAKYTSIHKQWDGRFSVVRMLCVLHARSTILRTLGLVTRDLSTRTDLFK